MLLNLLLNSAVSLDRPPSPSSLCLLCSYWLAHLLILASPLASLALKILLKAKQKVKCCKSSCKVRGGGSGLFFKDLCYVITNCSLKALMLKKSHFLYPLCVLICDRLFKMIYFFAHQPDMFHSILKPVVNRSWEYL